MEMEIAEVISIVTGFLIPLAVGILARYHAPSWLKATLNLGLSALASVLSQVVPAEFAWQPFIVTFALTWATSIASYYGFLKPTGTAEVVQLKTSQFGIGGRAA